MYPDLHSGIAAAPTASPTLSIGDNITRRKTVLRTSAPTSSARPSVIVSVVTIDAWNRLIGMREATTTIQRPR